VPLLSGILVAGCDFESKGARSFKSSLADVVYLFQSLDLGVRAFLSAVVSSIGNRRLFGPARSSVR